MAISNELIKKHERYFKSLPLNQVAAIRRYINGSTQINEILREGFDISKPEHCKFYGPEIEQRVSNMDSALLSRSLFNINSKAGKFYVYRGINSPTLGDAIVKNGYLYHPHYMSTSINFNVANSFAGPLCCVFRILVNPKMSDCPSFLNVSTTSENEILFERKTFLILIKETTTSGKRVFDVTISKEPPIISCELTNNDKYTRRNVSHLIQQNDIEDELAFLDDETIANPEATLEAIYFSLRLTYANIPKDTLKHIISIHLDAKNNKVIP